MDKELRDMALEILTERKMQSIHDRRDWLRRKTDEELQRIIDGKEE